MHPAPHAMHATPQASLSPLQRDVLTVLAARGLTVEGVREALALHADDIAYVAGSLVDGLGGPGADLDVFVVIDRARIEARRGEFASERRAQQQQWDFGIAYLQVGDTEIDVEFHPTQKFDALFAALNALRPVTRAKLWDSFRWLGACERSHALEILHRLRRSWPLGNEAAYASLRECFDESTFLQWNMLFCLMEAEDYAKGTRRSLREDDPHSACLKLRCFYDSLVDAALFGHGHSLDRWKWRLPKLRLLGDSALLADYLQVQFSTPSETGPLGAFVSSALSRGLERHARLLRRFE